MMWRITVVVALCLLTGLGARAQIFQTGPTDEIDQAKDSLILHHEWWLGLNVSAFYGMNFGTLTTHYIGGTSPESDQISAVTEGGYSYGVGGGVVLEYHPYQSPLSFLVSITPEWRWMQSESTNPISNGIFAHNATFETQSRVIYATALLSTKIYLGRNGTFAMVGATIDYPMQTIETILWQHERLNDDPAGNEPGAPQTSIRYATTISFNTRVGLQVGIGHDILTGLFGYRGQLITPYICLQGATPIVADPTSWNGAMLRLGAMWRFGI